MLKAFCNGLALFLGLLTVAFMPAAADGQGRQPGLPAIVHPQTGSRVQSTISSGKAAGISKDAPAGREHKTTEEVASEPRASPASKPLSPSSAPLRSLQTILADGTPIVLRAAESLSSAEAKKGDPVEFVVVQDVLVDGVPVVPKGTIARGTISEVKHKRRMARGGKLSILLDSIGLANGGKVPVRATTHVRGGNHSKLMATGMAFTSLAFYPAAPVLMMMHGKECVLLKGAGLTAYVNGDVSVNLSEIKNSSPEIKNGSARLPQEGGALAPASETNSAGAATLAGHSRASLQEILKFVPRRITDSEGREGDMVNLIFVGTREQVEEAFRKAGWDTTIRSKTKAVWHAMKHPKNQVAMPMSRLYLFGRPQDFALAMEDPESTMTRRHHIRIWKTDYDWNGVPVWVGAATHDIGVEKDNRSLAGITHKIDPNVDAEREFVCKTLQEVQAGPKMGYILPPDPVREAATVTGGTYYSDGRMLLMVLAQTLDEG